MWQKGGTSGWVKLCFKLIWALALVISSIRLTQLVVLDGAIKDAQSPSFTHLLLLLCTDVHRGFVLSPLI